MTEFTWCDKCGERHAFGYRCWAMREPRCTICDCALTDSGLCVDQRRDDDDLLQAARWVVENWDREATQHGSMAALRQAVQWREGTDTEDSWRDYDHGFRDGYQSALREHPGFVSVAEIKALLPRVYDGTHLVDCPYVEAFQRIREAISDA